MPPNTATQTPDNITTPPNLDESAEGSGIRARRRTARKSTVIPTPANDNDLKKQQIANNPYLPKPVNDNNQEHLKQFQGGAENAISKNLREAADPNMRFSRSGANGNNSKSRNNKSSQSQMRYQSPDKNFSRAAALNSAANNNNTQLNISRSRQEMNRKIVAVQEVLAKHGIKGVSKREVRDMIQHGFKHQFPAGMFALSVTKDFLFDPAVRDRCAAPLLRKSFEQYAIFRYSLDSGHTQ
jgi:hypothetical protein